MLGFYLIQLSNLHLLWKFTINFKVTFIASDTNNG